MNTIKAKTEPKLVDKGEYTNGVRGAFRRIVNIATTTYDEPDEEGNILEYEQITVEPQDWYYAGVLTAIIKAHYSTDQQSAILCNKEDGRADHIAEYDEMQAWRKRAKEIAATIFGIAKDTPSAKETALTACKEYAEALKTFSVNGTDMWLTPLERSNYRNVLDAAIASNIASVEFAGIAIAPSQGVAILNAIELWAMQVTQREEAHETAINALSEDKVADYDYTTGYPAKLTF